MKKALAALAMILGTSGSAMYAQEANNSSAIAAEIQVPQDEFVKMDSPELPQAAMVTLATDYEGVLVKEIYVKEEDETKIYKLSIITREGEEAEIILNERGEALKE